VGNDPRYQKRLCFDPFPFPAPTDPQRARIRDLAESLDAHRKRQQSAHPTLTLTGMYNVLEKLRANEPLSDKDKLIHEHGLVSVLRQLHDDLDDTVFDAYGWPRDLADEQILERLVALNAERAEEERRGLVRWLRPDFQNPSGAKATQTAMPRAGAQAAKAPAAPAVRQWPRSLPEQIAAVRDLVVGAPAAWKVADVAASFRRAPRADVAEVLDSLAALGLLAAFDQGGQRRWRSLARAT
jgi:hypothetical protein